MKAIIFGSIGTLVETSEIQRKSFNQAFKEMDIDWYWDKEEYKKLLKKSGGIKRVEYFADLNKDLIDSKKVRELKTQIFNKFLKSNIISPRDGVFDVIEHAKKNDIKIGLASTTTVENVDAIFTTLGNKIKKKDFNFIGNNTLIERIKPHPDIYIKAIKELDVESEECIAIEDSVESAMSAYKAEIECIAFPGLFHMDDDFSFCERILKKLDISILTK